MMFVSSLSASAQEESPNGGAADLLLDIGAIAAQEESMEDAPVPDPVEPILISEPGSAEGSEDEESGEPADEPMSDEPAEASQTFELEGGDVEEYDRPPSNFGQWWKGVREGVSLALTFDPVKKAEKRIRFAEERMRMAEAMADEAANDPKVQERMEKMIERANRFLAKVEEDKEKWAAKSGDRVDRLMRNIGSHQWSREQILGRLEKNMPKENLDKVRGLQQQGIMAGERLMKALENENIPERVKEHLEAVKDRIEEHKEVIDEFKVQRKELLDALKDASDEERAGLKEQLKDLLEEQKEAMEENRETFKERRDRFREERGATRGDEDNADEDEDEEDEEDEAGEEKSDDVTRGSTGIPDMVSSNFRVDVDETVN